ncbi:mechanosensitive ion channel family protein [Oceaniglobus ichthyenteri]|uniref:mechanosensitive ion channel family protein n=1 Tax=Oceaniglobus ichthyenteri TaxID=2136177 RepID=UPI0013DE152E|nr:mechanosensitive ion channel domain-containing protein [Oceaniglobus ichthyenteri]
MSDAIRRFVVLCLATLCFALPGWSDTHVFEIETLNPGLPAPGDTVDLRTPHGAMATLIDNVEEGRLISAAHALDLSDLAPQIQAEKGPELARMLVSVFERRVIIPWGDLLQRPDGLDANAAQQNVTAGEPRRALLLATVDGPKRAAAIRLERVSDGTTDPVWLISRETVAQIPALYALHGPSAFEEMLPDWLKQRSVFGLYVWELVALPLMIFAAYVVGRGIYLLFRVLSRRADGWWSTLALSALRWPGLIAAVTTVFLLATKYLFVFSGGITTILLPLIVIGYVTAALMFGLQLIDATLRQMVSFDMTDLSDHGRTSSRSLATALTAARRLIVVIALVIAVGFILSSARLYNSLGVSLLASAGAITLILGFAARSVLGNMLASLQIAINRSARIGDQIEYDGVWATVERIHFTFVQLKVWNGDRLVVPVEHFVSDNFVNYTLENTEQIRTVKMTLAQTADLDAMRDRFHQIVAEEECVYDQDAAQMLVYSQDAFGQVVRFQFPTTNPNDGWEAECRIREALMKAAQELHGANDRAMLPRGGLDDMSDPA